jgi:hypothetical protein
MIGVVQRRRDWIPGHVRLGNKAKSVPSSVGANTDRALERDRGVWGRHGITAELSWYIIDHSMNSWPGKRDLLVCDYRLVGGVTHMWHRPGK